MFRAEAAGRKRTFLVFAGCFSEKEQEQVLDQAHEWGVVIYESIDAIDDTSGFEARTGSNYFVVVTHHNKDNSGHLARIKKLVKNEGSSYSAFILKGGKLERLEE